MKKMKLFQELIEEHKPRRIFVVPGAIDFGYKKSVFDTIIGSDWIHGNPNPEFALEDEGRYRKLNKEQTMELAKQRGEIVVNHPHITGSIYYFVEFFSNVDEENRLWTDLNKFVYLDSFAKGYDLGCLLQSHLSESLWPGAEESAIEQLKMGYQILCKMFKDKTYLVTLIGTPTSTKEFSKKIGVPIDKIYHV